MHIPQRYRDRYDNLARSHPWMREMRDEQAPGGDAVAIMRECSTKSHGMATLRERLGIECVAGWQMRCLKSLADMVERDYVRRDDYDFTVEMLNCMKVERDEWKAKAEQAERAMNAAAGKWAKADARSAKRAAAVERLRNSEYHTALDDVCAMLGWGHEPHFEGATAALIDLLTDEGANDDLPPDSDVRATDADANDGNADSREKLEEDCEKLIGNIQRRIFSGRDAGALRCQLKELLDRQAAITERDMQAQVDELTEQLEQSNAKRRSLQAHIMKMQQGRNGWHVKARQLQKECDTLKRKLEASTDANDDYRAEWHRVCRERDRLRRDLTDEKNKRVEVTEKWAELKAKLEEIRRTLSE